MWVAAYNFHSFRFLSPFGCLVGALASVSGLESTCRSSTVAKLVSTWVKIRRGWRHSVLLQALVPLFFFLLWHHKDPRGRNGLPDLPHFHHCFPKHPWNVSSWKPPFHPESPAPRTPRSPRTWRVSLLKGKKKKKRRKSVQADSCSALRLFTFCTYTESHRVTSHSSGLRPKTPLHTARVLTCKVQSLFGRWHGEVVLLGIDQVPFSRRRKNPQKHSGTLCLSTD